MSANLANTDTNDLDRIHAAVKREKADMPAGNEPVPMWAAFLGMIVAVAAGGQLGLSSGGYSLESRIPAIAVADPRPGGGGADQQLDPFAKAMKDGANGYATCAGCHQGDGTGQPGKYPSLHASDWVQGGTERLIRVGLRGLVGPITINGKPFITSEAMNPPALSDQALADALTYVRNSFDNKGTMITKEMVAKVREAIKDHTGNFKEADLAEFAKKDVPGKLPGGPGAEAAPAEATAAPAAAPAK